MRRLAPILLWLLLLLTGACGQVRPLPTTFNPDAYTPVALEQLRREASGLAAGQLISFQAYFWEFLSYDPVPQRYYLNQLRYPQRWRELEWFALYQDAAMRGYFDRAVMSYEQNLRFQPKRLDFLRFYGELVSLGGNRLYFQTHHLEPVRVD
jgi:hypothetical protein